MIKNYLKIAFRNFWRHKLFTIINVIGLSIGVSAALVIYLIVHYDFSFDQFQPDRERIYRVVTDFTFSGEQSFNRGVSGPLANAVKSEVTGLQESAPFYTFQFGVTIPNGSKSAVKFKNQDRIILADARYFKIFPYEWLAGSPNTALNVPHQVVLTSEQAKKYYPSLSYDQMIGKPVIYEDTIKTAITGIVASIKQNTDFSFHDIISLSTGLRVNGLKDQMGLEEWGGTNSSSLLFLKLSNGTKPVTIERQINALFKRHSPPKPEDKGNTRVYHVQQLSELHFDERYGSFDFSDVASKNTLYGLLVIAVFLLLLGCINFVNLTTAQASQRAKEIGIRKTMGSTRTQLIVQFLFETFLITFFAVSIAVLITPSVLKLFKDFIPEGVKVDLIQVNILLFLLILIVAVGFLAGFYPALILSSYQPVMVLKNNAFSKSGTTRNAWLRKSLTVTQFVIAQFFIMATLLVSKQIYYALHKDLGFKKEAIIFMETPWKDQSNAHKQIFFNKVQALPQIQMTSAGNAPPSSNSTSSNEITYIDGKKEIKADVQMKQGDENYVKVYGIKLLAGRNLRNADSTSAMLINATYAKVLGFTNPANAVGILLPYRKGKAQVVGVMADFYQKSIHTAVKPLALVVPKYLSTLHISLKPQTAGGNEWKTAIAGMQKAWKDVYPEDDFEYHFFDESIAKFYEKEQHISTLLSWATGLSVLISCLGLLGLAIYTTGLRTKEIGVRKVLGATVAQVVTLLSTELIVLVLLAFVIVTPIAWYSMNKWMQNFADQTTISWWIFALSGGGMLLIALATLSFQTVKAAIANPVNSLKSE